MTDLKIHIRKKCSFDNKSELVYFLKCFYGCKNAKFVIKLKNNEIWTFNSKFGLLKFGYLRSTQNLKNNAP